MVLTVDASPQKVLRAGRLYYDEAHQQMSKVMLATGLIVVYGYIMEAFFGWYSAKRVRVVHD